ncbi:fibronectin type III-like domain-contianing protein [Streptomyces laurentii]|uniref:fibronectin type III-like domain-contianing protein n=1 Tax=Streptomyces laurentii TaxID=39478 RepID=UPI0033D024E4
MPISPGKERERICGPSHPATSRVSSRPALWPAGSAVVRAEAGTDTTITIDLAPRAFQYWSVPERAWITEPGRYAVRRTPGHRRRRARRGADRRAGAAGRGVTAPPPGPAHPVPPAAPPA